MWYYKFYVFKMTVITNFGTVYMCHFFQVTHLAGL